jgi:SAM-dependent methyltransferase
LEEVAELSNIMAKYRPVVDGDRVLELGTGWVHWQSIVVKLFAGVHLTMFDVVDSRLWKVFRKYLSEFKTVLPQLDLPADRSATAQQLVDRLLLARSFQEAYEVLGAEYIISSDGSMASLDSESYAMVTSLATLEHVRVEILPQVIAETYRLLRPGGYAMHKFDLTDHYSYFDHSMSPKNYLRFSPVTWDRWLSSRVMYMNRVQRPEWDALFEQANFEIIACDVVDKPLRGITVHPSYGLSAEDAQTTELRYVLRRR